MRKNVEMALIFPIIVLIIVFIAVLLTGCISTSKNADIAGKYVNVDVSSVYIEIHPDGTFVQGDNYRREKGTYEVIGDTLKTCIVNSDQNSQKYCYEWTISGNQLILKSNNVFFYYKKVQ
jgi:hypothetical protein